MMSQHLGKSHSIRELSKRELYASSTWNCDGKPRALKKEQAYFRVLPIQRLKPHEKIDQETLTTLMKSFEKLKLIKKAVLVDRETYVILDGHNRVKALELMGYRKAPCLLIDYFLPRIFVLSWRKGEVVSKDLVLKAALTGKLLPPKTSKHMIQMGRRMVHVSAIEPKVNLPLHMLL